MIKRLKALIIGAHPDDAELGCGGFIHSSKETHDCYALILSSVNRAGVDLTERCYEGMGLCGIPVKNACIVPGSVADFPGREKLWKIINAYAELVEPDIVFTHEKDGHPHHELVRQETFNQSLPKTCAVASYSCKPYLHVMPRNWYHQFSEASLSVKLQALSCYDSYLDKPYFDSDLIRAWALVCGFNHLGRGFAEAFCLERYFTGKG